MVLLTWQLEDSSRNHTSLSDAVSLIFIYIFFCFFFFFPPLSFFFTSKGEKATALLSAFLLRREVRGKIFQQSGVDAKKKKSRGLRGVVIFNATVGLEAVVEWISDLCQSVLSYIVSLFFPRLFLSCALLSTAQTSVLLFYFIISFFFFFLVSFSYKACECVQSGWPTSQHTH